MIGVSRTVAAEYTFFLAIPVMFGASILKIAKFGLDFSTSEVVILFVGCVIAFAVSLIVIPCVRKKRWLRCLFLWRAAGRK